MGPAATSLALLKKTSCPFGYEACMAFPDQSENRLDTDSPVEMR